MHRDGEVQVRKFTTTGEDFNDDDRTKTEAQLKVLQDGASWAVSPRVPRSQSTCRKIVQISGRRLVSSPRECSTSGKG